ncbi:MAG TPA: hypothetical protein PKC88_13240, partial [Plasticicumulans sp.]|nr:hypothetical protein [Plasticicumulans sp.]
MNARLRAAAALLLAALLLAMSPARAEVPVLVTVDLRHRNAEELIPLLRPVAGELTLSGQGAVLIVRGPQARIDELLGVLDALDVPPRTLLVSLRQGSIDEVDASGVGLEGGIGSGPGGTAAGGRVSVEHYGTRGRDDTVQTVRVLDGREAFVTLGRSVPVPERYGVA